MPGRLSAAARSVRRPVLTGALVLSACLGLASRSHAGCTVSATGVNFGDYDVYGGTHDDSTGTITYRCGSQDRRILIAVSRGTSGTFTPRTMTGAASRDRLDYNLYLDATRTTVWGDGTSGTSYYSRSNPQNNRDVTLTVYGRIPAAQDVSVDSYADTIIVSVEF